MTGDEEFTRMEDELTRNSFPALTMISSCECIAISFLESNNIHDPDALKYKSPSPCGPEPAFKIMAPSFPESTSEPTNRTKGQKSLEHPKMLCFDEAGKRSSFFKNRYDPRTSMLEL